MNISVLQENLLEALKIAKSNINRRPTLPVLSNVLLEVGDSGLDITATDLESYTTVRVGCRNNFEDELQAVCVEHKRFYDLVSNLPKERIDIETTDKQLVLSCGEREFRFDTIPADEFPFGHVIKDMPLVEHIEIADGKEFRRLLEKVLPAVAFGDYRPVLTGVNFKPIDSGVELAATDGFRLIQRHSDIAWQTPVILPANILQDFIKLISLAKKAHDPGVDVYIYENTDTPHLYKHRVKMVVGDTSMVFHAIDDTFPDYERIIPVFFDVQMYVERKELLTNLKQAEIFAREHSNAVRLEISDVLTITAQEFTIVLPVQHLKSQVNTHVSVNVRYAIDALLSLATDNVVVEMHDSTSPVTFRPRDNPASAAYVIMSMSIGQ